MSVVGSTDVIRKPARPLRFGADDEDAGQRGSPNSVVLLGPPAAGKGTLAELMAEKYGMVPVSIGDLLRAREKFMPELAEYMNNGKLVPDSVVSNVLKERLSEPDCSQHGVLLDGFPRTRGQAEALAASGVKVTAVIYLNVADDVVIERIAGRRIDPLNGKVYHTKYRPPPPEVESRVIQRADDTEEKIRTRLGLYYQERDTILSFYEDIIAEVQVGTSHPETLQPDVLAAMVFEEVRRKLEGDTYWGAVIRSVHVPKTFNCGSHSASLNAVAEFFEHSRIRMLHNGCLADVTRCSARTVLHAQMLHIEDSLEALASYAMRAWLDRVGDHSIVIGHAMSRQIPGRQHTEDVALGSAALVFFDSAGQRMLIPGIERLRQLVAPATASIGHTPVSDAFLASPPVISATIGEPPATHWSTVHGIAAVDLNEEGMKQASCIAHMDRVAYDAVANGGYSPETCAQVLDGHVWRAYSTGTFQAGAGDRIKTLTWEVPIGKVKAQDSAVPISAKALGFEVRLLSRARPAAPGQGGAVAGAALMHGVLLFVPNGRTSSL